MPGLKLTDMYGVKDILPNNRFVLLFGAIPGIGYTEDSRMLTLKCSQISMPGSTIETIIVSLFGHERVFRGRKTSTHQLNASFYEDKNMGTYITMRGWMNAVCDTITGNSYGSGGILSDIGSDLANTTINSAVNVINGIPIVGGLFGDLANTALRDATNTTGRVTEYKSDIQLSIINSQGHAAIIATIHGAFPSEVNSIDLDGSQTAAVQVQITFAYEWIEVRSGFSDTDIYTLLTSSAVDSDSLSDILSQAGQTELDNLIGAISGIGGSVLNRSVSSVLNSVL